MITTAPYNFMSIRDLMASDVTKKISSVVTDANPTIYVERNEIRFEATITKNENFVKHFDKLMDIAINPSLRELKGSLPEIMEKFDDQLLKDCDIRDTDYLTLNQNLAFKRCKITRRRMLRGVNMDYFISPHDTFSTDYFVVTPLETDPIVLLVDGIKLTTLGPEYNKGYCDQLLLESTEELNYEKLHSLGTILLELCGVGYRCLYNITGYGSLPEHTCIMRSGFSSKYGTINHNISDVSTHRHQYTLSFNSII